jgi:hypothetical protein
VISPLTRASEGRAGYDVEGQGIEVDLLRLRRLIWAAAADKVAGL